MGVKAIFARFFLLNENSVLAQARLAVSYTTEDFWDTMALMGFGSHGRCNIFSGKMIEKNNKINR